MHIILESCSTITSVAYTNSIFDSNFLFVCECHTHTHSSAYSEWKAISLKVLLAWHNDLPGCEKHLEKKLWCWMIFSVLSHSSQFIFLRISRAGWILNEYMNVSAHKLWVSSGVLVECSWKIACGELETENGIPIHIRCKNDSKIFRQHSHQLTYTRHRHLQIGSVNWNHKYSAKEMKREKN